MGASAELTATGGGLHLEMVRAATLLLISGLLTGFSEEANRPPTLELPNRRHPATPAHAIALLVEGTSLLSKCIGNCLCVLLTTSTPDVAAHASRIKA